MFIVSKEIVEKKFDELNAAYFNSSLYFPEDLDIDILSPELGYCVKENIDDPITLGLRVTYNSEQEFVNILAHEMIHLMQYQLLQSEPDHGIMFRAAANIITTTSSGKIDPLRDINTDGYSF